MSAKIAHSLCPAPPSCQQDERVAQHGPGDTQAAFDLGSQLSDVLVRWLASHEDARRIQALAVELRLVIDDCLGEHAAPDDMPVLDCIRTPLTSLPAPIYEGRGKAYSKGPLYFQRPDGALIECDSPILDLLMSCKNLESKRQ